MKDKLLNFIKSEILGDERISLDESSDLLISGLVDSVGLMRIIAYIEEEQNVTIPTEDIVIDNFRDVGSISKYLQKH